MNPLHPKKDKTSSRKPFQYSAASDRRSYTEQHMTHAKFLVYLQPVTENTNGNHAPLTSTPQKSDNLKKQIWNKALRSHQLHWNNHAENGKIHANTLPETLATMVDTRAKKQKLKSLRQQSCSPICYGWKTPTERDWCALKGMLKVLLFRIQQYYVNGEWSETNLLGHLSSLEVRDHPETTNHWLISLSLKPPLRVV